jgi:carbon starvation protein CstA
MLISAAIVLVVANLVNLSAIASVGSACSLMIFVLVGIAGYRLRSTTRAAGAVIIAGVLATLVVLAFFIVDTFRDAPQTFTAIVAIAVLAVLFDTIWKRRRGEVPEADPGATAA